jgi:hypothetical protein
MREAVAASAVPRSIDSHIADVIPDPTQATKFCTFTLHVQSASQALTCVGQDVWMHERHPVRERPESPSDASAEASGALTWLRLASIWQMSGSASAASPSEAAEASDPPPVVFDADSAGESGAPTSDVAPESDEVAVLDPPHAPLAATRKAEVMPATARS